VPMAVLAAILLVVAYYMGEWHAIPELWRQGWTDRMVWMVTFTLTVLADLTVAVEAGMILAVLEGRHHRGPSSKRAAHHYS